MVAAVVAAVDVAVLAAVDDVVTLADLSTVAAVDNVASVAEAGWGIKNK